jgi:uncharacterized protein
MKKTKAVIQPESGNASHLENQTVLSDTDAKVARQKLFRLEERLRSLGRVVVAFSGGVDSSFLAKVAHDVLGENALVVTAFSETFPPWERERALELARKHGFRHWVLERSELNVEEFVQNGPDRCYYCKLDLFKKLRERAIAESIPYILDGTTAEDVADYRPGRKALTEMHVLSPLLEADLRKTEIRFLSQAMGLETWEQPSTACLASRIPYGETVTREKLQQVEAAERYLRSLGVRQCRVRHHGTLARVEVLPADMGDLALKHRDGLVREFRTLGFTYVTVDLAGFRSGSLNEVLPAASRKTP